MSSRAPLAALFASIAIPGLSPSPELEPRLVALIKTARGAWPGVDLDDASFVRHLAERAGGAPSIDGYLGEVHSADLYLACAALQGLPAALSAFDRLLTPQLPLFLRKLRASPALVDEVRQLLCERLFVAEPGAVPKIAGYSGSGPLLGWLRVASVRVALNLQRGRQGATLEAERAAEAVAGTNDAEAEYLRARYGEAMNTAVREAFAALPPRQRAVMRLRFVDGLTDEKIGAVYGVHQSTVTRWIAAARESVMHETRRRLSEGLHIGPAELESLAGVLRSGLDLSLSGLLGPGAAG